MYIVSLVPYSESISYRKEVPQGPFNRRQFLARLQCHCSDKFHYKPEQRGDTEDEQASAQEAAQPPCRAGVNGRGLLCWPEAHAASASGAKGTPGFHLGRDGLPLPSARRAVLFLRAIRSIDCLANPLQAAAPTEWPLLSRAPQ